MSAPEPWGLLVLSKPAGISSHAAVRRAARALGVSKAGHAGTLDPMASGVLLVGLGKATRLLEYLVGHDKAYRAMIRLGEVRDTLDRDGRLLELRPVPALEAREIEAALGRFRGSFWQVPPAYSAIKIEGERLYRKARRGEAVVAPSRLVDVRKLTVLGWTAPDLTVEVACSKGTYVRALARDIGEALGTGGCLRELRRTRSGPFSIEQAVELETLEAEEAAGRARVLPPLAMLQALEQRVVGEDDAVALAKGRRIAGVQGPDADVAIVDSRGGLVAIARLDGRDLRPLKVFEPA